MDPHVKRSWLALNEREKDAKEERGTLTLKVRSWARGEVLKYSKMESWKSGSFKPKNEKEDIWQRLDYIDCVVCQG